MNGLTPVTDFSRGPQWFTPPSGVEGLDPETERLMFPLFAVWNRKRARNMLRSAYADGKHRLDHIGFSIPPAMRHIEEVVGWPAKAVAAHAERCMFDGFVSPSANDDPFDLDAVLSANQFDLELPQAIRSSMTHSVAFMTVSPGDPNAGEPPVIVMPYSAQWSAGLWNFRTRSLKAGLVVKDVDDYAMPTMYSIYTPKEVTTLKLAGKWVVDNVWSHNLGRVPMEALPYRPDIDRPFGRSIISRPVMSITDDAVRTVMRTEVSAEFYSAPQLLLLGADKDSFLDDKGNPIPVWEFIIGRINAISRDDNGDVPTVQQISQQSVQPHVEQMRELASRFAGETSVPVSSLGVVTDNPSSAEAMHAAEKRPRHRLRRSQPRLRSRPAPNRTGHHHDPRPHRRHHRRNGRHHRQMAVPGAAQRDRQRRRDRQAHRRVPVARRHQRRPGGGRLHRRADHPPARREAPQPSHRHRHADARRPHLATDAEGTREWSAGHNSTSST